LCREGGLAPSPFYRTSSRLESMELDEIPMQPALRKSATSYTGALKPWRRTRRSYDEARRVGPKGHEKYDGALRAVISSAIDIGLYIEDIQGHLGAPGDFRKVSKLIDASITDGEVGQIEYKCRALIAYFSRILPTVPHPQRRAYLQHIILGLMMKGGTNAQKVEAQGWLA
jgi:hypothetical protein